jgi:uncharacterized OsmC-like protein
MRSSAATVIAMRFTMTDTDHRPIVVTYEAGLSFAAQVRSHRLIVDQPESAGGSDSGPMPLELFGAALGTCIAYYLRQYMHPRGLPYERMRVEVDQRKATAPYRLATFVVRVVFPDPLPGATIDVLQRVARSCPAHGTLTHAADVVVSIEAAAAAAA